MTRPDERTAPKPARRGRPGAAPTRWYFVYGTLLDSDVRVAVLGRAARQLVCQTACLHGFTRVSIAGRSYPMVRKVAQGSVAGLVLGGLDRRAEHRLKVYEGPQYRLDTAVVEVAGNGPAQALLFLPRRPPQPAGPWRLAHWQRLHKRRFLRLITDA